MTTIFVIHHSDKSHLSDILDTLDTHQYQAVSTTASDINELLDELLSHSFHAILVIISHQMLDKIESIAALGRSLQRPVFILDPEYTSFEQTDCISLSPSNFPSGLPPTTTTRKLKRSGDPGLGRDEKSLFVHWVNHWREQMPQMPSTTEFIKLLNAHLIKHPLQETDYYNYFQRPNRNPFIPIVWVTALIQVIQEHIQTFSQADALALARMAGVEIDYFLDYYKQLFPATTNQAEFPPEHAYFGRKNDSFNLKWALIAKRCHIVLIHGVQGIGKTSLVSRTVKQLTNHYDQIFWYDLAKSQPFAEFVRRILPTEAEEVSTLFDKLLIHLQQQRCLIVLDNMVSLLDGGNYAEYHQLFQVITRYNHKSAIVLTSRLKPPKYENLVQTYPSIQSYALQGLAYDGIQAFLQSQAINASSEDITTLMQRTGGHPIVMQSAIRKIGSIYRNLSELLAKSQTSAELTPILDDQFAHLNAVQIDLVYWFAIEREWVSLETLQEKSVHPDMSFEGEMAILQLLQEEQLLEQKSDKDMVYRLKQYAIDYVLERLVLAICLEIESEAINLFMTHAIVQAQAKDYIRRSQQTFILEPIVRHLLATIGPQKIVDRLEQIIVTIRERVPLASGYAGSNTLTLLKAINADINSFDFSYITMKEADLREGIYQNFDFSHADLSTCTFAESFTSIVSLSISPNAEYCAFGTVDGYVHTWSLRDQQLIWSSRIFRSWVTGITFSSNSDQIVCTAGTKGLVFLDAGTGHHLKSIIPDNEKVMTIDIYEDRLVCAGEDTNIQVLNYQTGQVLWTRNQFDGVEVTHNPWINIVRFTSDGQRIISGDDNGSIYIWEADTGTLLQTLSTQQRKVYSLAVSQDGQYLIVGCSDNVLQQWDLECGEMIRTLDGHRDIVLDIKFSPDSMIFATASADSTIRLWNAISGEPIMVLTGHKLWVRALAFGPDHTLYSGSSGKSLKLWNLNPGNCLRTWHGISHGVRRLALSPNKQMIAFTDDNLTVHILNLENDQQIVLDGYDSWVRWLAFDPHQTILAIAHQQNVLIFDLETQTILQTLKGGEEYISCFDFIQDGEVLVGADENHDIIFWNVATGYRNHTISNAHDRWIWRVQAANNNILATAGADDMVKLWSIDTYACLATLEGHTAAIWALVFNPSGTLLATSSSDPRDGVILWDVHDLSHITHRVIHTTHTQDVEALAFSPDGTLLATGSFDETIKLWDVASGMDIGLTLTGHTDKIYAVAFMDDILVSGSSDGTVRFWDFSTGECIRIIRIPRVYENMNITHATGLSPGQKRTLLYFGAIDTS